MSQCLCCLINWLKCRLGQTGNGLCKAMPKVAYARLNRLICALWRSCLLSASRLFSCTILVILCMKWLAHSFLMSVTELNVSANISLSALYYRGLTAFSLSFLSLLLSLMPCPRPSSQVTSVCALVATVYPRVHDATSSLIML